MQPETYKRPLIIAISGRAGAGKDTVAAMIRRLVQEDRKPQTTNICIQGFAYELKLICRHLFGLTADQVQTAQKEVIDPRYNITSREILQRIAISGRAIDIDVWVNTVFAKHNTNFYDIIIIPDLRFPNELERIRQYPHVHIGVHRTAANTEVKHISEAEAVWLNKESHVLLDNDGSMEDLELKVQLAMYNFILPKLQEVLNAKG